MPARTPPLSSVARATASRRPSADERSATMSVSSLSIPRTRHPPARRRVAVAAPMPEAAPVMATVRSGSAARLEQGQRLVGVGAHGDLAVEHLQDRAVGVDDEGGTLDLQEADAALDAELSSHLTVGVRKKREAERLLLVELLLLLHRVGADAHGLRPDGREFARQVAEVTALLGA